MIISQTEILILQVAFTFVVCPVNANNLLRDRLYFLKVRQDSIDRRSAHNLGQRIEANADILMSIDSDRQLHCGSCELDLMNTYWLKAQGFVH